MNEASLIQIFSNLGFGGVLVWYCWYVTTTTLPKLAQQFREEASAIRAETAAERAEQARIRAEIAANFTESSAKEREHQVLQLDKVLVSHNEFSERLSTTLNDLMAHCKRVS